MPENRGGEPVNRRGISLVEIVIASAVAVVVAALAATLFRNGSRSVAFIFRESIVLTEARKVFDGERERTGLLPQLRGATAVQSLGENTLALQTLTSTVTFQNSPAGLRRLENENDSLLGKDIAVTALAGYDVDENGLVIESTSAATARLVTVRAESGAAGKRDYVFFSGAALRNRP
jgi:hypothetical protein